MLSTFLWAECLWGRPPGILFPPWYSEAEACRVPTWNLAIVLQGLSLAPFEPLEEVPDKFLTLKALFLLAISSLKRIGDLQAPSGCTLVPGICTWHG